MKSLTLFHFRTIHRQWLKIALLVLSCLSLNSYAALDSNPTETTSGVLVAQEPLASSLGLSEAALQYQIHYTSVSGVDGQTKREDTAAVFIPKSAAPKEGWPVVIWAHGTIGVASQCAPSLNPRTPRDVQYLNTWLSLGFAVVAPDYPGLGSSGLHHYLNARAEAWSVLDGARAALSQFPLNNKMIIVGQSQGAHAAFSAAGYQPEYAPELNIVATVLTGTPYFKPGMSAAQVFNSTHKIEGGDPKLPYAMYIYLSAADQDKTLKPEDYFQPLATQNIQYARQLCIGDLTALVMEKGLNASNSLLPNIETLLESELEKMAYPTLKINHPVFIGIGLNDVNVPTVMQQIFAKTVSNSGTQTLIRTYPQMSHSETVNVSLRDSVPFVLHALQASNTPPEHATRTDSIAQP